MSKFLSTDWAAMTTTDWVGLIILLLIAALMVTTYMLVLRPANRSKFEQHRDFVNHEDDMELDREVTHGQAK